MKDRILSCLPPQHPWDIQWFDCIGSTNTHAKELALAGARHGTVLIADRQTGGRGRLGRTFLSPAGTGIYMSVILKTDCPPEMLMHLTCATAVAACDAIQESAGFRPGIKWINDLVWGKRKLAGILTELILSPDGKTAQYAIIGIGINCHQAADDFPEPIADIACSVDMAAKKVIPRHLLAANLILAFEKMANALHREKETILSRYRENCITLGKIVRVHRGDTVRQATALDMGDDGSLIVKYANGQIEPVNSGEVSIRGMYGYN